MRNIHKSTPPSFRRRENAAAIVKAPPPGALTKGPGHKFPGLHPPPGGATSPSLSTNRRFAFPILALLAALAVGLLFLLPGGPLQAQDANGPMEYAENGTGPVATYTAVDPEEAEIVWSLAGADMDDFNIEGGVLTFKSAPDYETLADDDGNNVYLVTVQASDGGGSPAMKEVTVRVTNIDEAGTVTLSTLQPKAGVELTATLTDPDNITDGLMTWQWASSPDRSAWTDIEDDATSDMYTPVDGDAGNYLRATAEYKDGESTETAKSAEVISANAVLAHRSQNAAPAFPDQDAEMDDVQGDQKRSVAENTPAGQPVGAPVAATDADAADVLTYTLGGTDEEFFSIDVATGQLSTKMKLDFEATGDAGDADLDHNYVVTVTATDPFGTRTDPGERDATNSVTIMVTIEVTDVDEAPSVATGATTISHAENSTELDVDLSDQSANAATYTGTDPEDTDPELLKWSVSGADSGKFSITPPTGALATLAFKAAPDYEMPGDANGGNVYEVTVVVTDSKANTAMRDVTVKVTNEEEPGTVTLSSLQPRVGVPITARLTDPDGGISGVTWQWQRGNTDIEKAVSATYTPVTDDVDQNLLASASYTDGEGAGKTAEMASANAVAADTRNEAPVFPDQDPDTDGDQLDQERSVAEDATAAADGNVGDPVTATDATGDTLTYTLGGADAALFDIDRATGQITVGSGTKLDKESQDTSTVTVTATDSFTASSTITVTIKVTNVDETPELTGDAPADYGENGTGPVATYTAVDPEKADIVWTVAGADMDDFTIEGGVLRFKSSPDYEDATDEGTNNVYEVTVQAGDGGEDPATKDVTVTVTNVEEAGKVTLSTLQPKAGVVLTATLTDPDDITTGSMTWQWSSRDGSTWTDIEDATLATYTPADGDAGNYLRATAEYKDEESTEIAKTAEVVSANAVLAERSQNEAPAFPDQDAVMDGVQGDQERSVAENTPAGQPVGAPAAATDADADDVLTYTLGGTDAGFFSIDAATGQLRTKEKLDFEATGDAGDQDSNDEYEVTVTATDPFGTPTAIDDTNSDTIMVRITVTDVDEAPSVAMGATTISHAEGVTVLDVDLSDPNADLAEYTGTDPEDTDTELKWSVSGADSGKFAIDSATGDRTTLAFKAAPDYEMPGDANGDNVYEVTVVVTDSKANTAMRDVTVKVTNEEEPGTVTLSSLQPRVGVPITARLTDPDGGISGVTWQWYDGIIVESNLDTNAIEDAISATYTPVAGDVGDTLRARASYTDGKGADSAVRESASTVAVDTRNKAPVFPDQEPDTDGDQLDQERSVAEDATADADADGNVGGPVTATDATDENLTYTLGGADAALFDIDRMSGQITVGSGTKLDKETTDTYTVTVTATDSFGIGSTITVTIKVTDVDETPVISVGGLVVTGMRSVDYAENGEGMVATYTASGPDAAMATWSLSGEDMSAFSFSDDGMLTFRSSPDYEDPMDADMDNVYMVTIMADDRTAYTDTHDVMVMVTNVDEMGEVTLWAGADPLTMAPQVGETITGAVMDPDGGVTGESWQWARTMDKADMSSWMGIAGETNAAYTVTEGDTGYYLRVMATYTDAVGTDTAMEYSMPTMMVAAVGEMMGEVTLWAGADPLTMAPQVGDTITGAVMDPDGGVTGETWQWAKTKTPDMMESWMPITGETNAAYTVTEGDTGYYLRVMATYTDAVGTDTAMEYSMPTMMVGEAMPPGGTELERLIARYDTSGDGNIDKGELFDAIDGYLGFGSGPSWDSEGYTKKGLFDLIDSYLGF